MGQIFPNCILQSITHENRIRTSSNHIRDANVPFVQTNGILLVTLIKIDNKNVIKRLSIFFSIKL